MSYIPEIGGIRILEGVMDMSSVVKAFGQGGKCAITSSLR